MSEERDSCVQEFAAYHVVTSRPMQVGQRIHFDRAHPNGVFHRVKEKEEDVRQIKAHPEEWRDKELPHHTMVALRELALEEVRVARFPDLPSRLHCLYVSGQMEQAEKWARWFVDWGREVLQIVKLSIRGRRFLGNANLCFSAGVDHEKNLLLAEKYWAVAPDPTGELPSWEELVDGDITVMEILWEKRKRRSRKHGEFDF